MSRLARVIAQDVAHHITQRGNARRDVFDSDASGFVSPGFVAGTDVTVAGVAGEPRPASALGTVAISDSPLPKSDTPLGCLKA